MAIRLLLIDDDARLHELLTTYFDGNDVELTWAPDGGRGLATLRKGTFDAVLLDVMMPGMDGLEVLRRIRSDPAVPGTVPVLMLTAKGDETDRVVGLEMGADDYLPKPFSPRELLARIRAVLRRVQPELGRERLAAGGVEVDVGARTVRVDGEPVELTGLELDILCALMRRPGRVVPREALLEEAGRDERVGERTVDVHISKLRRKLGDARRIRTVRGLGYVFAPEDA